jgi:hypothetical protein
MRENFGALGVVLGQDDILKLYAAFPPPPRPCAARGAVARRRRPLPADLQRASI